MCVQILPTSGSTDDDVNTAADAITIVQRHPHRFVDLWNHVRLCFYILSVIQLIWATHRWNCFPLRMCLTVLNKFMYSGPVSMWAMRNSLSLSLSLTLFLSLSFSLSLWARYRVPSLTKYGFYHLVRYFSFSEYLIFISKWNFGTVLRRALRVSLDSIHRSIFSLL